MFSSVAFRGVPMGTGPKRAAPLRAERGGADPGRCTSGVPGSGRRRQCDRWRCEHGGLGATLEASSSPALLWLARIGREVIVVWLFLAPHPGRPQPRALRSGPVRGVMRERSNASDPPCMCDAKEPGTVSARCRMLAGTPIQDSPVPWLVNWRSMANQGKCFDSRSLRTGYPAANLAALSL